MIRKHEIHKTGYDAMSLMVPYAIAFTILWLIIIFSKSILLPGLRGSKDNGKMVLLVWFRVISNMRLHEVKLSNEK